jgi:hypothetical protein
MSKIKSFRGKLADDGLQTIVLHTNNGMIGYRIVKFQLLPTAGNNEQNSVVKIYSVSQTSATTDINFSDQTLLAAGLFTQDDATNNQTEGVTVIFDNTTFNQDITITHKDVQVGQSINYYIELEQVKLDLNQNTMATLKDIRNIESQ